MDRFTLGMVYVMVFAALFGYHHAISVPGYHTPENLLSSTFGHFLAAAIVSTPVWVVLRLVMGKERSPKAGSTLLVLMTIVLISRSVYEFNNGTSFREFIDDPVLSALAARCVKTSQEALYEERNYDITNVQLRRHCACSMQLASTKVPTADLMLMGLVKNETPTRVLDAYELSLQICGEQHLHAAPY